MVLCSHDSVLSEAPVDREVERKDAKRTKQRVVILGSGWAAVSILRELDNNAYEVLTSFALGMRW